MFSFPTCGLASDVVIYSGGNSPVFTDSSGDDFESLRKKVARLSHLLDETELQRRNDKQLAEQYVDQLKSHFVAQLQARDEQFMHRFEEYANKVEGESSHLRQELEAARNQINILKAAEEFLHSSHISKGEPLSQGSPVRLFSSNGGFLSSNNDIPAKLQSFDLNSTQDFIEDFYKEFLSVFQNKDDRSTIGLVWTFASSIKQRLFQIYELKDYLISHHKEQEAQLKSQLTDSKALCNELCSQKSLLLNKIESGGVKIHHLIEENDALLLHLDELKSSRDEVEFRVLEVIQENAYLRRELQSMQQLNSSSL
jgi:hypothetical protein